MTDFTLNEPGTVGNPWTPEGVFYRCKTCGHIAAIRVRPHSDNGVRGHDKHGLSVECTNTSCGIRTPEHYATREDAIYAWNRKPGDPAKRVTQLTAEGIKGEYDGPPPKDEAEHFEVCPQCGQAVDARDLSQVLHHAKPDHKPIATDS